MDLTIQLGIIMIGKQVLNGLKQILLPYVGHVFSLTVTEIAFITEIKVELNLFL